MIILDTLLIGGIKFVLGKLAAAVEAELNDDTFIKEQLLELQMRVELDEISDEEYREREAELFARLRAIKARQLDLLHQVHTAASSSMTVEAGGDEEGGFWEPGRGE